MFVILFTILGITGIRRRVAVCGILIIFASCDKGRAYCDIFAVSADNIGFMALDSRRNSINYLTTFTYESSYLERCAANTTLCIQMNLFSIIKVKSIVTHVYLSAHTLYNKSNP